MEPIRLIRRIHDSPVRLVLAVTGGGSRAISDLLAVAGASRTVLEAVVPYDEASLADYLGGKPEQTCSARTARALAMAAWQRAHRLAANGDQPQPAAAQLLAGIGCTAALITDRPRRGSHRAHVAVQTSTATWTTSIELTKGLRERAAEEEMVARSVINQAASACGLDDELPLELTEDDRLETKRTVAEPEWSELLLGNVDAVRVAEHTAGTSSDNGHSGRVIFPGAFHPLHRGHLRMAEVAAEQTGRGVEFELSIRNVDKPPLDFTEIAGRLAQFASPRTVWLTRAKTFLIKSEIFPAATFVVGADTIVRIGDPRYYGHNPAACAAAIDTMARGGCRFLVYGRMMAGGFRSLTQLDLPPALRQICDGIPEVDFRDDISSTEIRRQSRE